MEETCMYIGKKDFRLYTNFISKRIAEGYEQITIKSRGNNISKSVNLALWALRETILTKYSVKLEDKEIEKDKKQAYVSCVDITLSKG